MSDGYSDLYEAWCSTRVKLRRRTCTFIIFSTLCCFLSVRWLVSHAAHSFYCCCHPPITATIQPILLATDRAIIGLENCNLFYVVASVARNTSSSFFALREPALSTTAVICCCTKPWLLSSFKSRAVVSNIAAGQSNLPLLLANSSSGS